ncbi:MAG: CARDB domain-containing protein [Patescibacteria group bacterium]
MVETLTKVATSSITSTKLAIATLAALAAGGAAFIVTPVMRLADLAIVNNGTYPAFDNNDRQVSVVVQNAGAVASPSTTLKVEWKSPTGDIQEILPLLPVPSLKPKAITKVMVNYPAKIMPISVTFTVDPQNNVKESRENNNVLIKNVPSMCVDSDGGVNYNLPGQTSGCVDDNCQQTKISQDCCSFSTSTTGYCTSTSTGKYIMEGACQYHQVSVEPYYCPNGCMAGACLETVGNLYLQMINNEDGFNKHQIFLAGTSGWIGKLKLRAEKENIKLKKLVLSDYLGGLDSVEEICLYNSPSTDNSSFITCGDPSSPTAVIIDGLDYILNQDKDSFFYIYAKSKKMGSEPNQTAKSHDIIFFIVNNTNDSIIAEGQSSGQLLINGNLNGIVENGEIVFDYNLNNLYEEQKDSQTATTTEHIIAGSKIGMVSSHSSYGGETVNQQINGMGEYNLAILSLTAENHNNTDANGNPLKIKLGDLRFDISKFAGTVINGAHIQRIGGFTGSAPLNISGCDSIGDTSGYWLLNSPADILGEDAYLNAGETAYYVIKANISALDNNENVVDWIRLDLKNLDGSYYIPNNIDWFDGYSSKKFDFLLGDQESITGYKISEL